MHHWSKKNLLIESEEYGTLLYVGLSNSFFRLSPDAKRQTEAFISSGIMMNGDLEKIYRKTGALSEYSSEEMESLFKLKIAKREVGNTTMALTIAPTLDCNFRCAYCYEKDNAKLGFMTNDVMEALFSFIEQRKKSSLYLTWYGGEPLLALEVIKRFNEQAHNKGINLFQTIITNGYLLNFDVIQYFHSISLSGMQITLDGTAGTHNKRRPHMSNTDSYETILNNLDVLYHFCIEHQWRPQVSIRVNIDKENKEEYVELKSLLINKYNDFFHIYFGIVTNFNSCLDQPSCAMNNKEHIDFIRILDQQYGITENNYFPNTLGTNYCAAQTVGSFVFDAEGYMYKCFSDVGIYKKAVGHLIDKKISNIKLETEYVIDSLAINQKGCKECVLLYTCQGGCPNKRMSDKTDMTKLHECHILKNNIEEFLVRHYELSQVKEVVL